MMDVPRAISSFGGDSSSLFSSACREQLCESYHTSSRCFMVSCTLLLTSTIIFGSSPSSGRRYTSLFSVKLSTSRSVNTSTASGNVSMRLSSSSSSLSAEVSQLSES